MNTQWLGYIDHMRSDLTLHKQKHHHHQGLVVRLMGPEEAT